MKNGAKARYELPPSVVSMVKALCSDRERRKKLLLCPGLSHGVAAVLNAHDTAIESALEKIEPALRDIILDDICRGRGYDFSPATKLCAKNTYYARKRKFFFDAAVYLNVIDINFS